MCYLSRYLLFKVEDIDAKLDLLLEMYAEDRALRQAERGSSDSLQSTKTYPNRLESALKSILAKRISQDSTTKTSIDTSNQDDPPPKVNPLFTLGVSENFSNPHLLTVPNPLNRRHVKLCHSEHSNLSKVAESRSSSLLSPRLSEPIIHSVESLPQVFVQRDSGSQSPNCDSGNEKSPKKFNKNFDKIDKAPEFLSPHSALKYIDG